MKGNLIRARGQELDRLAKSMGYSRKGRIFKEEDSNFSQRLRELNKSYICSHQGSVNRNMDNELICSGCGSRV